MEAWTNPIAQVAVVELVPHTCWFPGVRQVLEASVVAHVFVAALEGGGRGSDKGIRPSEGTAADISHVGDGVQAAMRQGRVCIKRLQNFGKAGVDFRFTHVSSGYTVRRIAVTPYFSWEHRGVQMC